MDLSGRIEAAKEWLFNSGIQNIDGEEIKGSFNAWFDIKNEQFSFAYSEITGYGINMLLYLYKIYSDPICLERAKLAAMWLMEKGFDKEKRAILCRFDHDKQEFAPKRICVFDNGVCMNAFCNLYRITKEKGYLGFAKKIGNWILGMQKKDGSFYVRYIFDEDRYEHEGDKWSKQSGTFHSKIAIGLINLGLITGDERYRRSAERIAEWSLNMQQENGRFITDKKTESTFLHPHCYTMEGLVTLGENNQQKKFSNAVMNGINWIIDNKMDNQGFPAYYENEEFIKTDSPDINSQVLRIMMIIKDNMDLDEKFHNIIKYQNFMDRKETKGGFVSGDAWFHQEEENKAGQHVNSWVTMFIMQAMIMYEENKKGNRMRKEDLFYIV